MLKALYISLLLLGSFVAAQAQKKIIYEDSSLLQKDEPAAVSTTTEVELPNPDSILLHESTADTADAEEYVDTSLYKNDIGIKYDSVQNWRKQKEFEYNKYLDSLLRSLDKKNKKKAPESSDPGMLNDILGSGILQLLLWTFVICFVGFILYQLFLSDGGFRRRSKKVKDIIAEVEEEIITPESDFDGLIRQALQTGNYRQAIRYQYLRTLHMLADKNLVSLAPDKINYQYVSELSNPDQRQNFAALTLNFEYVWYGEFDIDKDIYEKLETSFRTFNQKI